MTFKEIRRAVERALSRSVNPAEERAAFARRIQVLSEIDQPPPFSRPNTWVGIERGDDSEVG